MSNIECAFFGALGRDAESKVSKNGKPYLKLAIRIGDGDDATWVNCMSFDQDAIAATEPALLRQQGAADAVDDWVFTLRTPASS